MGNMRGREKVMQYLQPVPQHLCSSYDAIHFIFFNCMIIKKKRKGEHIEKN